MTASNRFTDDRPSSDTTFVNGYNNQVSNYKTIQIVTGSAQLKLTTEQKQNNIHIGGDINEDEFVKLREKRDSTLGMPKLIMPSIQVNMRAGNMPQSEDDGSTFLKVPISGIRG